MEKRNDKPQYNSLEEAIESQLGYEVKPRKSNIIEKPPDLLDKLRGMYKIKELLVDTKGEVVSYEVLDEIVKNYHISKGFKVGYSWAGFRKGVGYRIGKADENLILTITNKSKGRGLVYIIIYRKIK